MKIAGLQKLSMVDYPGHVAAAIFLQGCNFRCGYCHNPELIPLNRESAYNEKDILDYLEKNENMLEGVVITGGEPLIHGDLPEFTSRIKQKGFRLKLDTNGSDPAGLEDLFRGHLLDYVAVDVKTSLGKYSLLTDVKDIEELISSSVHLTMLSTIPYEFRITCVPGIVEEEDIRSIAELLKGAKKCSLQQFSPGISYQESFQKRAPYGKEVLSGFRDILLDKVEQVDMRGI
ncbi:MAG: anaerobic ribonucleoside-triphosphate reductase activating protein [Candidatus Omnitrophica bacterium]|nr:anaerobic ribonucleoside-triphosphate reductase activating protein [Candidatus Omnitrophota bacterium]